ncbi:MAG TPA: hypothetical protein VKJ01_09070 [Candidatus Solibacter sp.]|jgi:hypothetical protein|nr:hypothetical protein [Candidatus Solibacter sp.]
MLTTDVAAPMSMVLRRLGDRRVRQFWDPRHLLAKRMVADAHSPQPKQRCCVRNGVLWDLAAVYRPGAVWREALPAAVFFDGPVVKVQTGIDAGLAR